MSSAAAVVYSSQDRSPIVSSVNCFCRRKACDGKGRAGQSCPRSTVMACSVLWLMYGVYSVFVCKQCCPVPAAAPHGACIGFCNDDEVARLENLPWLNLRPSLHCLCVGDGDDCHLRRPEALDVGLRARISLADCLQRRQVGILFLNLINDTLWSFRSHAPVVPVPVLPVG